jgi:hypothetical protein
MGTGGGKVLMPVSALFRGGVEEIQRGEELGVTLLAAHYKRP